MTITPFRKLFIGILGFTLLLVGLIGLLLPFLPGWLLIIAGLAVLSTEYVWAKRLSDGARKRATTITRRRRRSDDLAA
ncbi:MAG: PGPGW domain-containing protein [Acidimicrobiia bacterium]|nr:PGPGW domain-containing protein [Acidimicrobiia bacterium]MDH3397142.1 PGPGW domain-containing protein [Acidimicrobiia bacterium]